MENNTQNTEIKTQENKAPKGKSTEIKFDIDSIIENALIYMGIGTEDTEVERQHLYNITMLTNGGISRVTEEEAAERMARLEKKGDFETKVNPGTSLSGNAEINGVKKSITLKVGRVMNDEEVEKLSNKVITVDNVIKFKTYNKSTTDTSIVYYIEDIEDINTLNIQKGRSETAKRFRKDNILVEEKISTSPFVITNIDTFKKNEDSKFASLALQSKTENPKNGVNDEDVYNKPNVYNLYVVIETGSKGGKPTYSMIDDRKPLLPLIGCEVELKDIVREIRIDSLTNYDRSLGKNGVLISVVPLQELQKNSTISRVKDFEDIFWAANGYELDEDTDLHNAYKGK